MVSIGKCVFVEPILIIIGKELCVLSFEEHNAHRMNTLKTSTFQE